MIQGMIRAKAQRREKELVSNRPLGDLRRLFRSRQFYGRHSARLYPPLSANKEIHIGIFYETGI